MWRDPTMTFTEHLEELRWGLIKSFAAVVLAFFVCFFFSDRIVAFMIAPLKRGLQPGESLIGTGVTEAFFFEMKVALVAGVFLASPVIFYQIWRFIAPGLNESEKKLVIPFVLFTSFFFIAGAYFCYWGVLPVAFQYFIEQYRSLDVSPEIRIGEYFTFFSRMVLAFGITFELPLFHFFLGFFGDMGLPFYVAHVSLCDYRGLHCGCHLDAWPGHCLPASPRGAIDDTLSIEYRSGLRLAQSRMKTIS